MALLRNNALTENPYLINPPVGPEGWNRFITALNGQQVQAAAISGNIETVSALPTLPNTNYPVGSVVFYTSDSKLYRNASGTWTKAVDGADITANTIAANALTSGTISAADIQIGTNGKFRSGQTAYDTGTGWYLDYNGGTPRLSIGNSGGNKLTWNGSALSITGAITATSGSFTGGITVGSGGSISSGQSAYNTGTGYWLDYNGGTPRLSIGNSGGNKLTWDGTNLSIYGSMVLTNAVQTFTPTWTGFGTAPTGDLSYISFGAFAMLFSTADRVAVSNSTSMSITNLPTAITPTNKVTLFCPVVDFSGYANGGLIINAGSSTVTFIAPTGVSSDGTVTVTSTGFDGTGAYNKGIPSGWTVMYPLL